MDERIRREGEDVLTWANRINGTRNTNKVHCSHYKLNEEGILILCDKVLKKGEGRAVAMPWAGIRPRYYCEDCARMLLHYHDNARRHDRDGIGTPKKGDVENTTIGIEIEFVEDIFSNPWGSLTLKAILENRFNVITESDVTVDGEEPTDYMFGANILSKNINKLEKYGLIPCFNNPRCGAHMHVYVANMPIVRNWYHTLFMPLCEYFSDHDEAWLVSHVGRNFGRWANKINAHTDVMEHANFINCQHNNTLEFRLPRITGFKTYMNVVYFWRKVGYVLNSIKWIDNNGMNFTDRKKQASNVAEIILGLAHEHFGD